MFLMYAQIISSVIGLLYRTPLHYIMGDIGDGYYTYAFEWYTIILLLSSYSIPSAVSKVIAEKLAKKKYDEAIITFRVSLIYVFITGIISSFFILFFSPLLLRGQPDAVLALKILAPTVFLSGFLGVFRGLFQAYNTMKPTAISQIVEQITNAIFSISVSFFITRPFVGNENLIGKYGAAGGTIGTGIGVLSGFVFMIIVYNVNSKRIKKNVKVSYDKRKIKEAFKSMLLMITPIIFATFLYHVNTVVNQVLFTNIMERKKYISTDIARLYGLFGYRFIPIMNIPLALSSATSTALIPAIATSVATNSNLNTFSKIDECVHLTLFIAIPSAFGLCVMSYPIMRTLYPGGSTIESSIILSCGAIAVVFFSLSTIMNGILQGMGRPDIPVRNSFTALCINVITSIITIGFLNLNIYGLVLSTITYSFINMELNKRAIFKYLGYRFKLQHVRLALKPALIMSIIVALIFWVPFLGLNSFFSQYIPCAILTLGTIVVGAFCYLEIYRYYGNLSDVTILKMPMGSKILWIIKKIELIRRK